jgi:hypothetical protein
MLIALLLLLIGTADLVRPRRNRRVVVPLVTALWLVLVVVACAGCGVPLWAAGIAVVLAGAWLQTTTSREHVKLDSGLWPVAGLVAALVLALAFDRTATTLSGFVVDWHADAPAPALRSVDLPTLALALASFVFLTDSANVVVRSALYPREGQPKGRELPSRIESDWRRRPRVAGLAAVRRRADDAAAPDSTETTVDLSTCRRPICGAAG